MAGPAHIVIKPLTPLSFCKKRPRVFAPIRVQSANLNASRVSHSSMSGWSSGFVR